MTDSAGSLGGYRAHLDGLRAVAVYLVVAFHAGIGRASGGFIGVDVFFVLSGYLVTTVLLRDIDGPGGRIRLSRFYARRVRRLIPASAVVLVATAIVYSRTGTFVENLDARSAIRAAALYVSNWHFIGQSSDYFAADIGASPVLHFWSLSVEEQFYFLWPLLLTGLVVACRRLGTRQRAAVRGAVVALGLASALAALHISGTDLNRAYYGTDTRAYQLLAGAALALTPQVVNRASRLVPAALLAVGAGGLMGALLLLATNQIDIDPIQRGVVTAIVVVGLLVVLEASRGGLGARLLSLAPVVYLGKVSYGTYLWHWLVILQLQEHQPLGPVATFVVAGALATGLASLSYQLMELPIRSAPALDRVALPVVISGVVVSLLVGLLVVPKVLDRSSGRSTAPVAAGTGIASGSAVDPGWQEAWWDTFQPEECRESGSVPCELTTSGSRTALFVGDSHARMQTPMLIEIAEAHDIHLYGSYLELCPWPWGVRLNVVGDDGCFDQQDRIFGQVVPELDPDVVFLSSLALDDGMQPYAAIDREGGMIRPAETERLTETFERAVHDVVASLTEDGREVVMFEPVPIAPEDQDPLACLSKAKLIEECRFVTTVRPGIQERVMRDVADASAGSVASIDTDRLVCPFLPICDPVIDGLPVWRDNNHVTVSFWKHRRPEVERLLTDAGVLTAT